MLRICVARLALTALLALMVLFFLPSDVAYAGGLVESPAPSLEDSDSFFDEAGVRLAVIVIPVLLLALAWLGYIFWLIFHEGENVGSG
ncbi:MAG: hypothetical protein CL790_07225 [Chloroflexi bacterium]|nr:hypothetical protein [Chloroflexota bacterium]HCU73535.1 hypothetical protein [Chloroflexota bacterium]